MAFPFSPGMLDPFQLAQLFAQQHSPSQESVKRAVDLAAFTEKVPTGQTPREVVWTRNKSVLYHYLPQVDRRYPTPLLLIYALINKPYILDLYPGNSFVEHMVRQGFEVYLLDWGDWGPEDSSVSLDDLVLDYIPRTVRRTLRHAGQDRLTIMGYCIGGILTSIYAALHPDDPLCNVVVMAAPIDFADAGLFTRWLDPRHFPLDKLLATYGNMPGVLVELGAKMLKPMTNFVTPYVNLFDRVEDDRYVRGWAAMYQWVHDRVDFPGAAFRQLVRDLYQENRLIHGDLRLGGRQVDLGTIHWPFLLIAAERDHIAPLGSTLPLFDAVASADKEKLVVPAGHVGLVAGRSAVNDLWPRVSGWLGPRSG